MSRRKLLHKVIVINYEYPPSPFYLRHSYVIYNGVPADDLTTGESGSFRAKAKAYVHKCDVSRSLIHADSELTLKWI